MSFKLIFTLGIQDDEESEIKGTRGDLLLQDEAENFYELNFMTIERLNSAIDNNHTFYFEPNLLIMLDLKYETILDAIVSLIKRDFALTNWLPLKPEVVKKFYYPKDRWIIYEIDRFVK